MKIELEKWVIPGFVVGGLSNDQINNVIKYLFNNTNKLNQLLFYRND